MLSTNTPAKEAVSFLTTRLKFGTEATSLTSACLPSNQTTARKKAKKKGLEFRLYQNT
jgi:hypothetical protein